MGRKKMRRDLEVEVGLVWSRMNEQSDMARTG